VAHIHASLDEALDSANPTSWGTATASALAALSGAQFTPSASDERYLNTAMSAARHELKTQLFLPPADAAGGHGAEFDGREAA
jgi:hypothetical protein